MAAKNINLNKNENNQNETVNNCIGRTSDNGKTGAEQRVDRHTVLSKQGDCKIVSAEQRNSNKSNHMDAETFQRVVEQYFTQRKIQKHADIDEARSIQKGICDANNNASWNSIGNVSTSSSIQQPNRSETCKSRSMIAATGNFEADATHEFIIHRDHTEGIPLDNVSPMPPLVNPRSSPLVVGDSYCMEAPPVPIADTDMSDKLASEFTLPEHSPESFVWEAWNILSKAIDFKFNGIVPKRVVKAMKKFTVVLKSHCSTPNIAVAESGCLKQPSVVRIMKEENPCGSTMLTVKKIVPVQPVPQPVHKVKNGKKKLEGMLLALDSDTNSSYVNFESGKNSSKSKQVGGNIPYYRMYYLKNAEKIKERRRQKYATLSPTEKKAVNKKYQNRKPRAKATEEQLLRLKEKRKEAYDRWITKMKQNHPERLEKIKETNKIKARAKRAAAKQKNQSVLKGLP